MPNTKKIRIVLSNGKEYELEGHIASKIDTRIEMGERWVEVEPGHRIATHMISEVFDVPDNTLAK